MSEPSRVLIFDVETTGLHSKDRIVSLGMFELDMVALREGVFDAAGTYLIFDPGKKSHPRAEAVHGWSDWILRHQESFGDYAEQLHEAFDRCDQIVAHNAAFDRQFIETEFAEVGKPLPRAPYFCTMQAYRSAIGGRSGLDAALAQIGLSRSGKHHGALEDAWLAMSVYLWLHDLPVPGIEHMPHTDPQNLLPVPPEPNPLPRRSRRKRKQAQSASSAEPPDASRAALPEAGPVDVQETVRLDAAALDSLAATDPEAAHSRLWKTCRPMATLIMWIAHADGEIDDNEIAALDALVRFDARRLGMQNQIAVEQDIVAAGIELNPAPADVDAAAVAIVADDVARKRLPSWIRLVAFADGKGTAEERDAILRISEAMRRATSDAKS